MLLVVCPNLAVDRILQVDNFKANEVQRARRVLVQPGGKGSNVARVFCQLGGKVVLVGFVGRRNGSSIIEPLRKIGIHVDAVAGYDGESRTCTIICDTRRGFHPTVINEESPEIEPHAAAKLLAKVEKWTPRISGVLTTGSLSQGLSSDFYAEILARVRSLGKLTAIDATGSVLREGLLARPVFMKPNLAEFNELISGQTISMLAPHTAITFGRAGAALIHDGHCMYASPPCIEDKNPIGAGDAFAAGYLKGLLDGGDTRDCFRWAMAAAACDVATLRPGFIDYSNFQLFVSKIVPTFGRDPLREDGIIS